LSLLMPYCHVFPATGIRNGLRILLSHEKTIRTIICYLIVRSSSQFQHGFKAIQTLSKT
jgi:hypothetical protein